MRIVQIWADDTCVRPDVNLQLSAGLETLVANRALVLAHFRMLVIHVAVEVTARTEMLAKDKSQ